MKIKIFLKMMVKNWRITVKKQKMNLVMKRKKRCPKKIVRIFGALSVTCAILFFHSNHILICIIVTSTTRSLCIHVLSAIKQWKNIVHFDHIVIDILLKAGIGKLPLLAYLQYKMKFMYSF